jgi:hypothetical protein
MSARPISAHRFVHEGFIKFDEEAYPCTVKNMSRTGATLRFKFPVELPSRFTMQLTRDGMAIRQCAIAWNEGKQVGVLFEQA